MEAEVPTGSEIQDMDKLVLALARTLLGGYNSGEANGVRHQISNAEVRPLMNNVTIENELATGRWKWLQEIITQPDKNHKLYVAIAWGASRRSCGCSSERPLAGDMCSRTRLYKKWT